MMQGPLYEEMQVAFAYNSNAIEGSCLTEDQVRSVFHGKPLSEEVASPDDVAEARNHFRLLDHVLNTYDAPLTKEYLIDCHTIFLFGGLNGERSQFKTVSNAVGGRITTAPDQVEHELDRLLAAYEKRSATTYRETAAFHGLFERIHPFQDGNGRIGRMTAFKECLANDLEPFIVLDAQKESYYRALRIFDEDPDALTRFFTRMADAYEPHRART